MGRTTFGKAKGASSVPAQSTSFCKYGRSSVITSYELLWKHFVNFQMFASPDMTSALNVHWVVRQQPEIEMVEQFEEGNRSQRG